MAGSFKKQFYWTHLFVFAFLGIIIFTFIALQSKNIKSRFDSNMDVSPASSNGNTETAQMKAYTDGKIKFSYPATWLEQPEITQGSGYTKEFKSPDGIYILSLSVKGNYNQSTGKPFATLKEYAHVPYDGNKLIIDGQQAMQYLPRAGSEHTNSVDFFSEDKKTIYTVMLQTGDNPANIPEAQIVEGQNLFDLILSSFRFKEREESDDNDVTWVFFESYIYDFKFKYPAADYILQEDSGGAENSQGNTVLAWFVTKDKKELEVSVDNVTDFTLKNLRKYAPTGSENTDPVVKKYSNNTFYYYGPGGGGVCYPDRFFYNLNGKVLIFEFSGCGNDKTPPESTKETAKTVLSSFAVTK